MTAGTRRHDRHLDEQASLPRQRRRAAAGGSTPASAGDPGRAVVFDPRTWNPVGRSRTDRRRAARLRFGKRRFRTVWWAEDPQTGSTLATGRLRRDPLDHRHRTVLAAIDVMRGDPVPAGGDPVPGGDAVGTAALLARLAATGTVLHLPNLPEPVAALLSTELTTQLRQPLPDELSDPLEWEIRSVRQRRAALRAHSARPHGDHAGGPAVSVLLVTMRPRTVARVVRSIAHQTYPQVEIVVGVHGFPLSPDARRELASCGRPVQVVEIPQEANLGEALGMATGRASGQLVAKMDDDDIYGADHLWDLVLAREFSGATVVGKGAEFVYLERLGVTVRRSSMARETFTTVVAGGTILLARRDLGDLGGWHPVPQGVDRSLLDQVQREGGSIYRTHPLGFIYCRHSEGHTWDPGLPYFLRDPGPQWHGTPPQAEFAPAGQR